MQSVWVVIPAYNESKRLRLVINETKRYTENIVVIDDGSKDNTSDIAFDEGAIVLRHMVNFGKGAALKTGCDYAVRQGSDILIAIDADGQHNPSDIPKFIEAIEKGSKIVFGYRTSTHKMPFILKHGNSIINWITKSLYGINLRDTQSGFRAFTKEAYRNIRWNSSDYSMESEMIANLGKNKMKYTQIPIPTIYHDNYKGTTIKDGIKIVFNMILWRFTK